MPTPLTDISPLAWEHPADHAALANLRGIAGPGDEFSLIAAQTPLQWSEFAFARARYSAPIDADGATLAASVSYGRTHPGASLGPLDVVGKSVDAVATYSRPLMRSRTNFVRGDGMRMAASRS